MEDDAKVTLDMLSYIERRPDGSQRSMASQLGIAVGLTNTYVKRCVKKGLVKMGQAPTGRYLYYLTPQGFAEKARLSAEFLSQSFKLIRAARSEYGVIFADCRRDGRNRVLLAGASDLVEVALMCAAPHSVAVVGVVDPAYPNPLYDQGLTVRPRVADFGGNFDTIVLTDLKDPQRCFDSVSEQTHGVHIVVPPLFALSPAVTVAGME